MQKKYGLGCERKKQPSHRIPLKYSRCLESDSSKQCFYTYIISHTDFHCYFLDHPYGNSISQPLFTWEKNQEPFRENKIIAIIANPLLLGIFGS